MKVQFKLTSKTQVDNKEKTKLFGNIATEYAHLSGGEPAPEYPFPAPVGGAPYNTFLEWADAAGRALATLSTNTYINGTVVATWNT